VRFWDSSALVPLVVQETSSQRVKSEYDSDRAQVVWCLSIVEVWSAVTRKRREGILRSPDIREARQRLQQLVSDWTEIEDVQASTLPGPCLIPSLLPLSL
jgi:uncharacterized protein with PIN domain